MNTSVFTNSQFYKLKEFDPGKEIVNTECKLYIIGSKINPRKKLLKKFYNESDKYISKKVKNLDTLVYYRKCFDIINEFVMPENLAVLSGRIIGYTMPFIENSINLQTILKSNKYTIEEKIYYLKQIGKILNKMEIIKKFPYEIRLGDLHEANFIVDEKKNIRIVDMDSAYISNNEAFHSKYLFLCHNLLDLPHKYQTDDDGDIIPSKNSDLFCYITIILNTLSGCAAYKFNLDQFYNYINYLNDIGINKNLLDSIEKIYQNGDNENPLPYLDEIPIDKACQAHRLVYKAKTKKDIFD